MSTLSFCAISACMAASRLARACVARATSSASSSALGVLLIVRTTDGRENNNSKEDAALRKHTIPESEQWDVAIPHQQRTGRRQIVFIIRVSSCWPSPSLVAPSSSPCSLADALQDLDELGSAARGKKTDTQGGMGHNGRGDEWKESGRTVSYCGLCVGAVLAVGGTAFPV
jgi:hypothetical protein